MTQFDPKQPFSEIWGKPGLAFQQNGNNFNARGDLVTDFAALEPIVEIKIPDDLTVVPKCYTQEDKKEEIRADNIENLHWTKLKAMLAIYGEEYTGREHAISYLKGQKK